MCARALVCAVRPIYREHESLAATAHWHYMALRRAGHPPGSAEVNATLSPFFNIADVPGEYRLCDMLCAPGVSWPLSLPVVKHLRSAYEVSRQGGERLVKQVLYAKPEDPDAPAAFFRRGHSQTCAAK